MSQKKERSKMGECLKGESHRWVGRNIGENEEGKERIERKLHGRGAI